MQVPCTPPGNIQVRVTSAAGSYIRLVLLQVRGVPPYSVPRTPASTAHISQAATPETVNLDGAD